jgi:Icc-related predicted phosphoesterase
MRLVFISDTHMQHDALDIPECDVLIHAGDFSGWGSQQDLERFVPWLASRPAREKVFIAGNHDFICEQKPGLVQTLAREAGVHYLADAEFVVRGLRIWGSPFTPHFCNLAFNRERGREIRAHWDRIPEGIDVLVTHGPPMGVGDRTWDDEEVGCEELLSRVRQLQPRLHVFGHIHEARGEYALHGLATRFLNVSSTPLMEPGIRPPVVVDL